MSRFFTLILLISSFFSIFGCKKTVENNGANNWDISLKSFEIDRYSEFNGLDTYINRVIENGSDIVVQTVDLKENSSTLSFREAGEIKILLVDRDGDKVFDFIAIDNLDRQKSYSFEHGAFYEMKGNKFKKVQKSDLENFFEK